MSTIIQLHSEFGLCPQIFEPWHSEEQVRASQVHTSVDNKIDATYIGSCWTRKIQGSVCDVLAFAESLERDDRLRRSFVAVKRRLSAPSSSSRVRPLAIVHVAEIGQSRHTFGPCDTSWYDADYTDTRRTPFTSEYLGDSIYTSFPGGRVNLEG